MCLLCEEAKKSSKIREDKDSITLVFEGFDLFQFSKNLFNNARDFRDYPSIIEKILWEGLVIWN